MPLSHAAVAVAATVLGAAPAAPQRELDNVAAFARLYGVVRFFYPSDAAAELDWDRFAVHGTSQARRARSPAELEVVLEQLVAPLGPGIEVGTTLPAAPQIAARDEPLVAWRHQGAGLGSYGGTYASKRTNRSPRAGSDVFVTLMQTVSARELRGRRVRLHGHVRAVAADRTGSAALWLRVDRPNGVMGFFDNMADRPVRDPEWRSYSIEGPVADDAETVALGVMAIGAVTADFDEVELAVSGDASDWSPVPIRGAGFEDSAPDGRPPGWSKTGLATARISLPAEGAPQGRRFVRFAPDASEAQELFGDVAPRPGAAAEFEIGLGLRARVPLALPDADARPTAGREDALRALRAALVAVAGQQDGAGDQRLADVVTTWNVFRHFYPYWSEAGVDWDSRLHPALAAALAASTRAAQGDVLRRLVAEARDGHGSVRDSLDKTEQGQLPVGLAVVEDRLVVTASDLPAAPAGAVVTTIDGVSAAAWLARATSLASGSPQWLPVAATRALARGARGETVSLGLDDGTGPREVTLVFGERPPPAHRPPPLTELAPGTWYVDLTRAKMAEIEPRLETLAAAKGVVFDVRGYPSDAGSRILPHLLEAAESDRWMHVAKIVGPFYETAGWASYGWNLAPASPYLRGKRVFLTDGSAISYAESVMGYVADRKLATIVGVATAGTNGNVVSFTTPGGFTVRFTGMRVTRHDGSSTHHLVGVTPDVPVAPTITGIRAGRDEVLERALALLADR